MGYTRTHQSVGRALNEWWMVMGRWEKMGEGGKRHRATYIVEAASRQPAGAAQLYFAYFSLRCSVRRDVIRSMRKNASCIGISRFESTFDEELADSLLKKWLDAVL